MLERLRIKNLAIVEAAELSFTAGLNVITGETGAGKSLLIESVNLLTGGRADSSLVREGATSASVEGEFRLGAAAPMVRALLEEWGIECDGDTLIVRREIAATGKSRALVNQSALTQNSLRLLGELLADLHGQHEHQSLLRANAGTEVLDRLGGCAFERELYLGLRERWRAANTALDALEAQLATYEARRAQLLDAAEEIDALDPREGEEAELRNEAGRLAHAERLRELVTHAVERLAGEDGAVLDRLHAAAHALDQAAALDPSLRSVTPALDDARIAAADAARVLEEYASRLGGEGNDPDEISRVELRRESYARMSRKYRRDAAALVTWREELRQELATGEDAEGALARARDERSNAAEACAKAGRAWSLKRKSAARTWGQRLSKELPPLGLPHGRIEFAFDPVGADEQFPPGGLERVDIRFTANPGEQPAKLQKVASGGELSRVMLALKCALEAQDRVDVRIFDEVDSGIGGPVAQAVGERLRRLAAHGQVVCVTHLPMIAALGQHHLHVTKHVAAGRTHVRVATLEGSARIEELARMLAGDRVSETSRRQAREWIAAAEHTRA